MAGKLVSFPFLNASLMFPVRGNLSGSIIWKHLYYSKLFFLICKIEDVN